MHGLSMLIMKQGRRSTCRHALLDLAREELTSLQKKVKLMRPAQAQEKNAIFSAIYEKGLQTKGEQINELS